VFDVVFSILAASCRTCKNALCLGSLLLKQLYVGQIRKIVTAMMNGPRDRHSSLGFCFPCCPAVGVFVGCILLLFLVSVSCADASLKL